jgi:hypothetical protein
MVDGGYYDVYGIASLIDWLDEALGPRELPDVGSGSSRAITRIFLIQIRGAPPEPDRPGQRRGWFYQVYAPLATLLGVRGTGQLAHNEQEIALLRRAWEGRVSISSAVFQFCGGSPPLSWHMTPRQVDAIGEQWEAERQYQSTRAVLDFLGAPETAGGDPPGASVDVPARCAPTPAPRQDSR